MSFAVARWSLVAVGLGLAFIGCGGGAPGEPLGETASAVTFANDKAAFDYFLGKGLANFQAAGIVGNLDQESGVDPTAVQAGGPGRGIAQWSVGGRWDTDASDNATSYAASQGQSVDSLQLQLDFIWYELTTFPGYGLAALQQSTDVTTATIAFETDFEGCGTCDQSTRIAYAQNVLSTYGSDMVDGGGSTPDAGDIPCTVPGVGSGVCILTSACAAMPGHVSTPNYCPGAADVECCTGPTDDAGMPVPTDAASEAAPTPSDSGTDASEKDAGRDGLASDDASPAPGEDFHPSATSNGCSTASGPALSSPAGYWLLGLVWVVARRRKRACRPS